MADAILEKIDTEFQRARTGKLNLSLFYQFVKEEFGMLARNAENPPTTAREEERMPICLDTIPYISGEVAREVLRRYFWGYYHPHKMVLMELIQKYNPREPKDLYVLLTSIFENNKKPYIDQFKLTMAQQEVEHLKKQLQRAEQEVEELKKNQTV